MCALPTYLLSLNIIETPNFLTSTLDTQNCGKASALCDCKSEMVICIQAATRIWPQAPINIYDCFDMGAGNCKG